MAQKTSMNNLSRSMTCVKRQDEGESLAIFKDKQAFLKILNKKLSKGILENLETQLEQLKNSSFFISVLPKEIVVGQQNISIFRLLDPKRLESMKKMSADLTKIQLCLLQEYLEQLKKNRRELVELVQLNNRDFSLKKHKAPIQYVSEISELLYNFKNMLEPGQLHIKHRLMPHAAVSYVPPLTLLLRNKGPVIFDQEESTAYDNWAFLSWHVSGQRHLTDSYELCFQQIDVPTHKVPHSGVYIVTHSTFKICNLLLEKTYKFSIRRVKACNLVYDEWYDVITMSTGKSSSCHAKSHTYGDYKMKAKS
ncbi:fibronectin type III domain-containing protein 11 [Pyxicephalus adspersus]|uniref:Fibronectin type III domain-containing protein 11 n=1 Tax=Pyxicephalus adspersus TaxID=30357 RepID=A0AAV3ACV4_PYXAD|nr:TPA: hypothetical protein GDO54_013094 [Pyxicephalus adspersus]